VPSIAKVKAREVLDSRGRPTVEVDVIASSGARGRAIVPSGASTGAHEAVELRDHDQNRYAGKGVLRAVGHVTGEIARAVLDMDLNDQAAIDAKLIALDGTPNKARLGANAVLGASLAVAHAAAAANGEELYVHLHRLWKAKLRPGEFADYVLPLPMVNMISGGLHAGKQLDFQDFLMVPIGARSYHEALEMMTGVYRCLGEVLHSEGEEASLVGDEGGYGPKLRVGAHAVKHVLAAMLSCQMRLGIDAAIALDAAATHLYDPESKTYELAGDRERPDAAGMIAKLAHWVHEFPIVSIEDPLAEDDWEGWIAITAQLGRKVQLVGDDLFATHVGRLQMGIERKAANAVLIKLNQVGTLSETLDAILLARRHGYRTIISARSGDTEDTTIADLAVATGAGQIKVGSVTRSERLAKYNRLLRIEEELGDTARFAGKSALRV
jgi:enolase